MVNGRYALVGTDHDRLQFALRKTMRPPHSIHLTQNGNTWRAEVAGDLQQPAKLWQVTYLRHTETAVPSGENKGKYLENYNVVTDMNAVATLSGDNQQAEWQQFAMTDNTGCALLLESASGELLGAAHCPDTPQ